AVRKSLGQGAWDPNVKIDYDLRKADADPANQFRAPSQCTQFCDAGTNGSGLGGGICDVQFDRLAHRNDLFRLSHPAAAFRGERQALVRSVEQDDPKVGLQSLNAHRQSRLCDVQSLTGFGDAAKTRNPQESFKLLNIHVSMILIFVHIKYHWRASKTNLY